MSGDNYLQATLAMDAAGMLTPLKAVQSQLVEFKRGTEAAGSAVNGLQQKASAGMKATAAATKEAGAEASRAERTIRTLGRSIGKLGGPLGEMAARIGGGAGMAGAFGRLAAGAALAGLAWKAFSAASDAGVARLKAAQSEADKYFNAIKSGQKEIQGQALQGLNQDQTVRRLTFSGGEAAVAQAQAIAQNPDNPTTFEDAAKGVEAINALPAAQRAKAIAAAQAAARSGVMTFGEAAQRFKDSDFLRSALSNQDMSGGEVAGRMVHMATASPNDPLAQATGEGWQKTAAGMRAVADSQFLQQSGQARAIQARRAARERELVASGMAVAAAREQAAREADPIAANINEIERENALARDRAQAAADKEWGIVGAVRNVGMPFGGEGSQQQQANRLSVAQDEGRQMAAESLKRIADATSQTARNTRTGGGTY